MTVQMCPIDIPDGWEVVRYGVPKPGEYILDRDRRPLPVNHDFDSEWIVIRPARPALEVGDWVRVDKETSGHHGAIGRVSRATSDSASVCIDGTDYVYFKTHLTKQTRTIDPYTLDQCIAAAARLGREVVVGSEPSVIQSFGGGGITTDAGAINYSAAARHLTWANGESFGIERWEDAE